MRNIALVGFMGTGKSTIGFLLAIKLQAEYIDLDQIIEKQEGMKIAEIFSTKGELYFRNAEKEAVAAISLQSGKIIACGGGVVLREENVQNLKKNGVLICLEARPEVILDRTKDYAHRPLLNVDDPKAKIEELLKTRKSFYDKADYSLDSSDLSVQEVVDSILIWIKGKV